MVLGVWRFLVSEKPLWRTAVAVATRKALFLFSDRFRETFFFKGAVRVFFSSQRDLFYYHHGRCVQGYLTYKKTHPPRTLP